MITSTATHIAGSREWDVVVIGAGAAGLTAAVYMAKAGLRVAVLERGAAAGGRAMSTELGGAAVNLGAHALYAEALEVLREVGVEPAGASPKPNASFVFGAEAALFRAVPLTGMLLGRKLSWGEKTEFLRFYMSLKRIDTELLQSVSLRSYLAERFRHNRVAALVESFVRLTTYSNAPDMLSAGAALAQLQRASVLYLHGGWQTIVDSLLAQALQAGAVVAASAAVCGIEGNAPEMTAQLTSGEQIRTRRVLSTLGPAQTLELLAAPPVPDYERKLRSLVPIHAACLDIVLDGIPLPKANFALGIDRPLYLSNHSNAARLSPNPEHAVFHLMNYLPCETNGQSPQDAASLEAELERLMDTLQPGWRKRVVARRFLPHMLVSHAIVTAQAGGLKGRPSPEVEGKPGLYTAGDWVGSEGMLMNAALASARKAAQRIIKDSLA